MYRDAGSDSSSSAPSSRRQSVNDEWTGVIPMDIDVLEEAKKERDLTIQKMENAIFTKNNLRPAERRTIDRLKTELLARQTTINAMLNRQSTDLAFRRQIFPATRGQVKQIVYGM